MSDKDVAAWKSRKERYQKRCGELTAEVEKLRERIEELEKGEYICKKCGLRKDGEGSFSKLF